MTPRRAPTYLALIVAMLVALIAPAAIADDVIPPEGEPPTTTTVPASTTTTTVPASTTTTTVPASTTTTTSIPPTTTTTTTVVAEPPPAVAPPAEDEEPPVPPEAAPEPPPPAETPAEPETPPGDGEPAESEEEEIEFDPLDPEQVTRDIVFPVVGASTFSKGFGDCRDGCRRSHNGIDILTHRWKGSPVVAAHDGRVTLTRTGGKLSGCAVVLKAEDGWTSHYVHLNTDIPGTDSEADLCFAPGIEVGAEVTEGTILGWIGDSGNAEHTQPHLHFEIRNPDGIPVDSWYSLKEARRIEYSLIDAADLVLLGTALFGDDASTAFVIDVADLFDAAEASTTSYESPLIPLDPEAPSEAFIALASIEPERIIVFTDNDEAGYLEELRRIAPIVEISEVLLPRDVPEEELIDADGDVVDVLDDGVVLDTAPLEETDPDDEQADEPIHMYDAEEPSTIVVVAGDDPRTMDELMERYEHLLGFVSPNDIPGDLGFSVGSHPGVEANRSAFWWQIADGWALTEELPADRPLSIAVVRDPEDEATLNFLVSLSVSPSIPLWHDQPTSPTIKSL